MVSGVDVISGAKVPWDSRQVMQHAIHSMNVMYGLVRCVLPIPSHDLCPPFTRIVDLSFVELNLEFFGDFG